MIEAWALHAMDTYDRAGSSPGFQGHQRTGQLRPTQSRTCRRRAIRGVGGILLTFVRGLSGRHLKLEKGEAAYTDSETLFLPAVVAQMRKAADNFKLCKAMVALLWAQTRFGTFRINLSKR